MNNKITKQEYNQPGIHGWETTVLESFRMSCPIYTPLRFSQNNLNVRPFIANSRRLGKVGSGGHQGVCRET